LRFVLPYQRQLRPAWLLRLGLFIYDHLGGRHRLPATRTLDLRSDPAGAVLKPEFARGFAYSDCWVDDSRLVVLNARDAADHGATIAPRTECVSAQRAGRVWNLSLRDQTTQAHLTIRAKALVNAAGPWVAAVAESVIRADVPIGVRLVKGSHIVVKRLFEHDAGYILQNADRRIFFLIPYERDFTLIGTTDQDFTGDPAEVRATAAEIAYLCDSASAYLGKPVTPDMVVWSYSGVRPLFDDGSADPRQVTRDYVLNLHAPLGVPALLSIVGGKITTYRRLAEAALALLQPYLPAMSGRAAGWTGHTPLPGGDFPVDGFDREVESAAGRYPFLPEATLRRLLRAYGTRIDRLLGDAAYMADLGRTFGADLTEAELRYLATAEWARTAADVVWRRSKLGLWLSADQIGAVEDAMRSMMRDGVAAA
jgi:glycerol-3-phosphate dehydrogenase